MDLCNTHKDNPPPSTTASKELTEEVRQTEHQHLKQAFDLIKDISVIHA